MMLLPRIVLWWIVFGLRWAWAVWRKFVGCKLVGYHDYGSLPVSRCELVNGELVAGEPGWCCRHCQKFVPLSIPLEEATEHE